MRTLEAQDRPEILELILSVSRLILQEWRRNAPETIGVSGLPGQGQICCAQNSGTPIRSVHLDKDGHVTDIGRKLQPLPLDRILVAMALVRKSETRC